MAQDNTSSSKPKLGIHEITTIVTQRKKAGLIISNCASIPQWLPNEQLPQNIIQKIGKDNHIYDSRSQTTIPPLQSTFTDGYAMYTTYKQVENCEVDFITNVNGNDLLDAIDSLFSKSTQGYNDFFIHYSGFSEDISGNWMAYDSDKEGFHVIKFEKLLKRWNQRPRPNEKLLGWSKDEIEKHRKDQYCLVISDANFSGVWAARGQNKKVLNSNLIIQSAVSREEEATELNIGQIVNGWITQIICSKFTHCWIEISDNFIKTDEKFSSVLEMKGSFVLLDKSIIWDKNDEYHTDLDHPMSNVEGRYGEHTIVILPCYGHDEEMEAIAHSHAPENETKQDNLEEPLPSGRDRSESKHQHDNTVLINPSITNGVDASDALGADIDTEDSKKHLLFASGDLKNALQGLQHRSDDSTVIKDDNSNNDQDTDTKQNGNENENENKTDTNTTTVALKGGDNSGRPRRRSHLPQPSVRRLNILDNLKSGKQKLKHVSKKSTKHKSTNSKFIFAKVLADIRQLIMPDSDKEEDDDDDEDEQTKKEWLA